MVNAFSFVSVALVATATVASGASMRSEAAPMPTGAWPTSQGNEYFDEPYVVKPGEVYDGKMKTFQRSNVKCAGQRESGWQTAVFRVEPGGTLKNVIIGKDQMEGVHCEQSGCTIQNVWWDDVCEDALSIKGGSSGSVAKVIGGGARHAQDKVVQHNGQGTVSIEGFYVEDFGKLYRSCGTCGLKNLKVNVKNVYAVDGRVSVVTVNENWGDQATLENIKIKGKKINVCSWSDGTTSGGEPDEAGAGPSGNLCKYSPSTITYV
ncbi:putative pectate lyase D [Phytophthora citrophthora]|uniref:Probable pectate lyase F n=1 Tax=Phytophthora citrophthora TaxID=4793 RepID=A0AAD9GRD8_9STRA|nr:putative pectate lyase D [Phytophthora citrophthora]KAK1943333.1 putative pectate lyase D [Phytophthora citrophthora]